MSPLATLSNLPLELVLEIASHLDPLVEEEFRAVVSLWALRLVSSEDFSDVYLRSCWGFSWHWAPHCGDNFLSRFMHDADGFRFFLNRALDDSVGAGKHDLIDAIAERGVAPTCDHLIIAAQMGQNDTIDHLVERYQLDPNRPTHDWTPLYAACLAGQSSTVRHLIEVHEVEYTAQTSSGFTALNLASRWPDIVADLVARGLTDQSLG